MSKTITMSAYDAMRMDERIEELKEYIMKNK